MISIPMAIDYQKLPIDQLWEEGNYKGLLMHSVHAYPAKFPPFIATKAFDYAINEGVQIHKAADIFCGCGTTALESKCRGISFWGCDINPVAIMIASAKTADYDIDKFKGFYPIIVEKYQQGNISVVPYELANERLKYWYSEKQYNDLYWLLNCIKDTVAENESIALNGYLCIFSSILKKCSRWLQKSIKPQVDKEKKELSVLSAFKTHYKQFIKAVEESQCFFNANISMDIIRDNFLKCTTLPEVDLIVTSPPYVTSYEYADLHQLSSLWLGYTKDYKTLREGTIGSGYNYSNCDIARMGLNQTATEIIRQLDEKKCPNSKLIPVARYYAEMQSTVKKCYSMLNNKGMALFVIGDSELRDVKLMNSTHLIESMRRCGFNDLKVGKRTISKGICVPFRDEKGRFTQNDSSTNQIYHEEYIISGRK